jgi:serine/threonine protein kinase
LDGDRLQLLSSTQRIKTAAAIHTSVDPASVSEGLSSGHSSVATIALDSELQPIAMNTSKSPDRADLIHREVAFLKALNHPLVFGLRGSISDAPGHNSSILTEYAGNGSLADFVASDDQRRVCSPNRIAKIVVGIALAMRFVHSRDAIYRDLCPANVLLDWDWTVRIANFGLSASHEIWPLSLPEAPGDCPPLDSRYHAPECYNCTFGSASDVFAFGLILFELLVGRPAFPESLNAAQIGFSVVIKDERPEIPDSVLPRPQALIEDCWAANPDDRATFEAIVKRLAAMEFKVTAHVNSGKVARFVKMIKDWERENTGSSAQ